MKIKRVEIVLGAIALVCAALFWREASLRKTDGKSTSKAPAINGTKKSSPQEAKDNHTCGKLMALMVEGTEVPRPTAEQLSAFVEKQNHSVTSLLAAWQLGENTAWLDEAAERYPDDPRVALAKIGPAHKMKADAKEWIERLKQNDPNNAVGWCYDALSLFKEGATEDARTALAEAAKRGKYDVYKDEMGAAFIEAYHSAGYGGLAGTLLGSQQVSIPQLSLVSLLQAEAISQFNPTIGDALFQDMLTLSANLHKENGADPFITMLVSSSLEERLLKKQNAHDFLPGSNKLVLERLHELDTKRKNWNHLISKSIPLLAIVNDSEYKQYLRRVTVEGEMKAMQWLLSQHPEAQ